VRTRRFPLIAARGRRTAGGVALLFARGVLLWIAVPLAACVWLASWPRLRRRNVGLATFVAWVDLNLIALLERTLLRPFFRVRADWVPWSALASVTHRIRWLDPV